MMFCYSAYSALEQFDVLSLGSIPCVGFLSNTAVFTFIVFLWLAATTSFFTTYEKTNSNLLSRRFFLLMPVSNFMSTLFRENIIAQKNVFFYFLSSLFTFLLVSNLVGMIPYAVTITSYMVVTFFFSCTVFIASTVLGLYIHRSHFFSLFIPAGTPPPLKGGLVFIEVVSYFARLFSLAIRLFANMMAGHALLKILSGFAWTFLQNLMLFGLAALAVLLVVWAVTILELLIAFLQAYVFVVLTSIYLNEAVNLH